jgi:hypothetical protein
MLCCRSEVQISLDALNHMISYPHPALQKSPDVLPPAVQMFFALHSDRSDGWYVEWMESRLVSASFGLCQSDIRVTSKSGA